MGSNMIRVVLVVVILAGMIWFITSDKEIKNDFEYCADCQDTDDCYEPCKDSCLKKAYDNVNSTGIKNGTDIYCRCECSSTIKKFIGGSNS